jgi:protein-tyrosine-phosphatase
MRGWSSSDYDVQPHIDGVTRSLAQEFAGVFSPETVDRFVHETWERYADARIKKFTPVLVHRFARERLRAWGQVEGSIVKEVPEVLFVCVHNAGRSQMAAALLDHHAEGRVHVRSAGSAPADEVHRNVVDAMSELGLDISQEFPKPWTDEVIEAADVVVTMGCGDACPVYPGKRYLDWELDDPAGKPLEEARAIRDDIDQRVQMLLAELVERRLSVLCYSVALCNNRSHGEQGEADRSVGS